MASQSWTSIRDGLDTPGYSGGDRGSPLGNVDTAVGSVGKHLDAARVRFHPAVNEDLAATAVAGTQQLGQVPGARHDGVFAAWYGKGPGVDRSGDAFTNGNSAGAHANGGVGRLEERRGGKEGVGPCRYRWAPVHSKKKI